LTDSQLRIYDFSKEGQGAVVVKGVGCGLGGWDPPQEKNHFVPKILPRMQVWVDFDRQKTLTVAIEALAHKC